MVCRARRAVEKPGGGFAQSIWRLWWRDEDRSVEGGWGRGDLLSQRSSEVYEGDGERPTIAGVEPFSAFLRLLESPVVLKFFLAFVSVTHRVGGSLRRLLSYHSFLDSGGAVINNGRKARLKFAFFL